MEKGCYFFAKCDDCLKCAARQQLSLTLGNKSYMFCRKLIWATSLRLIPLEVSTYSPVQVLVFFALLHSVCMYVCMCVCVCMYVCMYVCMHVYVWGLVV